MMRTYLFSGLGWYGVRRCRTGLLRTRPQTMFMNLNLQSNGPVKRVTTAGLNFIRWSSTSRIIETPVSMATSSETLLDMAPGGDTSTMSRWAEDAAHYTQDMQLMGELAAAGLGGYSPVGLLQQVFEFVHVSYGLPWWASIAVTGLAIRILMYPLVIKAQQNSARLSNISPEMERISKNMREANMAGNSVVAGMEMAKLQALFESNNIKVLRNLLPLAQAPVFISFFIALRQMARLPVESMKTGGMFWFSDLTVPDPYLLLPLISVCSMLLVMEIGAEGGVTVEKLRKLKWVFRGMAIITFPIMVKMPAALFMYWIASNSFALSTAILLKFSSIRQALGIPKITPHPPTQDSSQTGFMDGLKQSHCLSYYEFSARFD